MRTDGQTKWKSRRDNYGLNSQAASDKRTDQLPVCSRMADRGGNVPDRRLGRFVCVWLLYRAREMLTECTYHRPNYPGSSRKWSANSRSDGSRERGKLHPEGVPGASRFLRSLGTKLPNFTGISLHSHHAKNLKFYKLQTYWEWGGGMIITFFAVKIACFRQGLRIFLSVEKCKYK